VPSLTTTGQNANYENHNKQGPQLTLWRKRLYDIVWNSCAACWRYLFQAWKFGGFLLARNMVLFRTVTEELRRRRLWWIGHISRTEIDRLPARALYCHVTGERSQERQAKKWIKNIKEDFELRNIKFKDAIASCKDRTAWRQYRHRADGQERRKEGIWF